MFQGGFTLQRSRYDVPVQWGEDEANTSRHFLRAPDRYGYFMATWAPGSAFSLSGTGTYSGPMHVPHFPGAENNPSPVELLRVSGDFLEIGLKLAYDFELPGGIILQLNCGMQNILNSYQHDFDIGVDRDAGYVYGPISPRTVFFGISLGNL
jgi:outer membrane receptor for ferrienterochelin and colicins